MTNDTLSRAEAFIWANARLLDRRLFVYQFQDGVRDSVLTALLAYQNADGGFGNALEPDIRCPESQPVPTQHALEILDVIGFDGQLVHRICDYLLTITTAEGGVPWLLPSAHAYPRAPWWNTADNPPASLNPTAAIAGLLHKNGITHPWLEQATAFCWSKIAGLGAEEVHELGVVFTFLQYVPERQRADREIARLSKALLESGLVADVQAEGYVRKPLDWAPTPDHPLRTLFGVDVIAANLEAVVAAQQPDGGWNIAWPPISLACEQEWRGWVTRNTLLTLRANGYL